MLTSMLRSTALAALVVAPIAARAQRQPTLGTRGVPVIEHQGLRFRDLNRSSAVEPYEDWRLSPDARARDLVSRMTLAEKAGAMMHGTARAVGPMGTAGVGTSYDTAANAALIRERNVTSMITRLGGEPGALAAEHNVLQALAEASRLGIPLTISTDPRHHFQYVLGASVTAGQFSQWPEPLGLAAIGDTGLVRTFGDIARREYRAVGIHMALSPQADLATEPRWSRINGTFGEDPALAARMTRAYVEGFQHGRRGVDTAGVATIVKHWVGYGAATLGYDSHSYYGRFASISEAALQEHAIPFRAAFEVGVAGVMPTYSILEGATWKGRPIEPVGAAFNRQLLTEILRGEYAYRGVVITDWAVTNDCSERCRAGSPPDERPSWGDVAMPWGVENLPMRARFVKAVQAGVDQFGGTERADLLVEAARAGELREARLDTSVVRVMAQKFAMGLFENPYVDTAAASRSVATPAFRDAGLDAQRRSLVLLENRDILPLERGTEARRLRVYLHGIAPGSAEREGWSVVADPKQADVAIMRFGAPFETLHPGYIFGAMQHEGALAWRDDDAELAAFRRISAAAPTIVTVYLDRPAILTPLRDAARALLANFGVSDAALMDVLTGRVAPQGRLPFELPSSMRAVEAQRSDRPRDSASPLYPFGFGRSLAARRR